MPKPQTSRHPYLFLFVALIAIIVSTLVLLSGLLVLTSSFKADSRPAPVGQNAPPPIAGPSEPVFVPLQTDALRPIRNATKYHIQLFSASGMLIGDWISTDEPESLDGNSLVFTDAWTHTKKKISGTYVTEEVVERPKPKSGVGIIEGTNEKPKPKNSVNAMTARPENNVKPRGRRHEK